MISKDLAFFVDWSYLYKLPRNIDEITAGEASYRLRRMLVDGNPLIHLVNKDKRQSIKIPLQNFSRQCLNEDAFILNCIDFNDAGNPVNQGLIYNLSIQKFLSHGILEISGRRLSVREVIKLVANNLGGVHFEENGWKKVVDFDPHVPANSHALRSAIVAIARSVSYGTQTLSKLCSPFPDYSKFLGHYDANPGVIDFESSHGMNVNYKGVDAVTSIAVLSVMELKPQANDQSVFFLMQGSGGDYIEISFTPMGDMCLEISWGEDKTLLTLNDDNKVRPIGKMVFMCVCVKLIENVLHVSAEINGNRKDEVKRVETKYFSPLRSVIGGGETSGKGCSFRLKELFILNQADGYCINSIRKYSFYRYQLA